MRCPNPKCKGGPRLETKQTFDELFQVRRVKYCPKCGQRVETIEMFTAFHNRELQDAKDQALSLSNIIGQREDSLMEVREAVQVLIRQGPADGPRGPHDSREGKIIVDS